MEVLMNLKQLTDAELWRYSDIAVDGEREATSNVLHHFQEIERRRLYCTQKCESLFQLVMKRWGYTENEAVCRISAMRLLTELPEIEEKISTGALTLTHLNMARSHFRNEKKENLKEISREVKIEILKKLENTSKRESHEIFISLSTNPQSAPRDEIRPLDEGTVIFKFAADKQTESVQSMNLFDEKVPWPVKVNHIVQEGPGSAKVNQSAVNRMIWQRDKRRCTNCGSTFALEKDHSNPKAKGGDSSTYNLRLLCRKCNQRAAIEHFGLGLMDKYLN
jgi:hypothetical protein